MVSGQLAELNERIAKLSEEGRLREVEPLLRQAAALARQGHGEFHPAHATILNDLGGLYRASGEYAKYGAGLIDENFGAYSDGIAAGLVGDGSECYGFDDELSRDHDWGPGFCLWLPAQEYREVGAKLGEELAKLPHDFEGVAARRESRWGKGRVGALATATFYERFLGIDHAPNTIRQWRAIPESHLAAATNGKVFRDPLGEFTRIREALLSFFPEDVRLKKMQARCMTIGQAGQYNFGRCAQRKELVAAQQAEAQFCAATISLIFLLNRRYTPFYKWMHRALRSLPILGEVCHGLLAQLAASYGFQKKSRLIEDICCAVAAELRREGLSAAQSDFLLDHGPSIQERIQDPALRDLDVWVE